MGKIDDGHVTTYIEANRDEYSTRDQPAQRSFYDRHGHDERDGSPEEEEERGGVDNLEKLNYRWH